MVLASMVLQHLVPYRFSCKEMPNERVEEHVWSRHESQEIISSTASLSNLRTTALLEGISPL
uniref:Uncharacterized protein n=1 Tax=Arundo donax TaxID=35708 RepID=A0A0A9AGW8_ARUDO